VIVGIVLGIVSGLLANELCEFSPWCARRLVRWSAFRRYADPGRAEMRAEELAALINDRPGNLFKLITAIGFAGAAVIGSARRAAASQEQGEADQVVPSEGTTVESAKAHVPPGDVGRRLSVNVAVDVSEAIDQLAKRNGPTTTDIVRRAVSMYSDLEKDAHGAGGKVLIEQNGTFQEVRFV
jgi:Ribbon-helix-helix protein, copG family